MKFAKLTAAVLLVVATLVSIFAFTANASTPFDGLDISLSTDKDSYSQGENVSATLKVKNTNEVPVNNLKLEMQLPKGFKTEKSAEISKDIPVLEPGVSGSVSVEYISSKTNTAKVILLCSVLGVVAAGTASLVIVSIIRVKKAKQILSVFLCILMVGSLALPVFGAKSAEEAPDTRNVLNVSKTVKIDGKKTDISAKVYYEEIDGEIKNITISTDEMLYSEDTDTYVLLTPLNSLEGLLQITKNVKSATCKVTDVNGKLLCEKKLKAANAWSVDDIGLIVGLNTIAVSVEYEDGTINSSTISVNNVCAENMDKLNVDKGDDDDDGVLNFIEDMYLTDKNSDDTDSDGISDYHEMAIIGTDPAIVDTDDNGTDDGDEDADNDGLTNNKEINDLDTDPIVSDTDGDLVGDADEVNEHNTDPLKKDTDEDGRDDYWELDNGYDPTEFDSDLPPQHTVTPDNVQVDSEGSVTITTVPNDPLINENTPGYIGEDPIKVEIEEGCDATITIDYDTTKLGEGESPTLYYFNEETQKYEPVPTTVDEEGNATATVNKNGVYVLLNHRYVDEVWDNDIFRPSENADDGPIDVIFVIDRSQSMDSNDPNGIRKLVTKEFIAKLRDNVDRAGIVQFTAIAETIAPLMTDKEALYNAVDGIENSDGGGCAGSDANAGTNGSAGIRQAITELESSTASHKYIIFLTDGEDTSVSEDYGDEAGTTGLTGEARSKGIIIHTVGLIGTGGVDVDLLKRVAKGTGGNYYVATVGEEAENENELVQIYDQIESVTIDRQNDTNEDLISDYYTRVICNGELTTATGLSNLFGPGTYDEVQKNDDFDGDGIINGEELMIVEDENGVYVKVISYPFSSDSDNDGLEDPFEIRISSSPLKKNAYADVVDVDWVTDSENFMSDEYLDLYNESVWERGSVFIGNAFFGTTLDQTTLYRKALVDYFNAIDAELVSEADLKNYKDLVSAFLYESAEDIKNNIIQKHLEGDTQGVRQMLNDYKDLASKILGIDTIVGKSSKLLADCDNIFLELLNLADSADVKYYDNLLNMVRDNLKIVPSIVPEADKNFWNSFLDASSNLIYEYGTQKGIASDKIALRLSKFSKFSKAVDAAGKIVDFVGYGLTAWNSYADYCSLLAGMETIEANIYVLDCVKNSSGNVYLTSAARELCFYMNESYSADTREFAAQLRSISECGVSMALDYLHGAALSSGVPVLVAVELVRTFGNLFFDIDKVSEASAKTVALALSADILAENLMDHFEGGYAIETDTIWVGYADYSDDMYKTFLNLIELRKMAEKEYINRKDGEYAESLAQQNITECDELLTEYKTRYFSYYLD